MRKRVLLKKIWKRFKLPLLFSAIVFFILLITVAVTFLGTMLLAHRHIIQKPLSGGVPLIFFCLVCVLIGTVMAAICSRLPLRPLREIMSAADRIADGDYSVRLHLQGPEEFRELGDKFNHMVEEIGGVELLRSDFVNNFSHEFKTPIVSIRGFAKALKWNDLTEAERTEYLDIIISESERLSSLSENVLYLSKLEKQSILTDKKRFNLSEQLRLVIVLLDRKFTEKQLDILFDNQEYFVTGNEEMLRQVWINLLDNAVKFSPRGGLIDVRVAAAENKTVVRISDEGGGISPDAQAHIFDKFYQGERSHSTEGNGLGLAIVKKIIDLHGGAIAVRSSDAGSVFEVTLN